MIPDSQLNQLAGKHTMPNGTLVDIFYHNGQIMPGWWWRAIPSGTNGHGPFVSSREACLDAIRENRQ